MLGPGSHLVERDEDQDGRRDDRPDHLEPLAAVEVLGLAAPACPAASSSSANRYDAQTSTIWVPMKTMPVIQRMMMKRLSISRPKVEITCGGSPGQRQPPVRREGGVDKRQHTEESGQAEQDTPVTHGNAPFGRVSDQRLHVTSGSSRIDATRHCSSRDGGHRWARRGGERVLEQLGLVRQCQHEVDQVPDLAAR